LKKLRFLFASVFCLAGVFIALTGAGLYMGSSKAEARSSPGSAARAAHAPNRPDVMQLVGPVRLDQDLRTLPYIPNEGEIEERQRRIFPFPLSGGRASSRAPAFPQFQSLLEKIVRPMPSMPPPLLTFDAMYQAQTQCMCMPPDTNGDVGPNHYVQSVNVRFAVYDKNGNTLLAPTTFNSFFAPLVGTPCSNSNKGDPFCVV
jgi:hypothetical protein